MERRRYFTENTLGSLLEVAPVRALPLRDPGLGSNLEQIEDVPPLGICPLLLLLVLVALVVLVLLVVLLEWRLLLIRVGLPPGLLRGERVLGLALLLGEARLAVARRHDLDIKLSGVEVVLLAVVGVVSVDVLQKMLDLLASDFVDLLELRAHAEMQRLWGL